MNIAYLASRLQQEGWNNIGSGEHCGIPFDLIGSRTFLITQWNILIKFLPVLDAGSGPVLQRNFETISRQSKSLLWGRCFVLCLVAGQIAPEVLGNVRSDSFGLFGAIRLQGGGGRILIADEANRQVYGQVPALPMDAHKFTGQARDILFSCFGS